MRLKETTSTEVQQQLLQRLESLFSKDGYQIVELNYAVLKHRAHFRIVLFHPAGVSLDACAEMHKIVDVEIERLGAGGMKISDNSDYSLELSSPGLGRRLQSYREFQVFCGQDIRCLVADHWYSGVLLGLKESKLGGLELSLESTADLASTAQNDTLAGILNFPLEEVLKVELDS